MLVIIRSLLLFIVTLTTITLVLFKRRYKYWKKLGIPFARATIPFGSLKNPIYEPESFGQLYKRLYKEHKEKGFKHIGLFSFVKPVYMPIDLELIKRILLKDFDHFYDRGIYHNEKCDPLSAHLFALEGTKWRKLRTKMSPTFTSGKLKSMFSLVMEHALQLTEAITNACSSEEEIDAKLMMSNYFMDIIGSTAFGLDCNSFKNPNSEYRKQTARFFEYTKLEALKVIIFLNNHKLGRFFKYCITPEEVSDFFLATVKETINYRESTNSKRNDFLQSLIELKNSTDANLRLTFKEVAAQAFVLFAAGTDASSTTLSCCMYELALNEEIQERVRKEMKSVLRNYGGELNYESLLEMKYMQQVVDETLRKYPTVPQLNRVCTKDYQIPGTDIVLKVGTHVAISVLGIHHDEEYYPNHQTFDPERFNEINKAKLPSCCYLPFGQGPRECIAFRFGFMQIKIALATLLKRFKFSLGKDMSKSLKMSPYSFVLMCSDSIWLKVEKI